MLLLIANFQLCVIKSHTSISLTAVDFGFITFQLDNQIEPSSNIFKTWSPTLICLIASLYKSLIASDNTAEYSVARLGCVLLKQDVSISLPYKIKVKALSLNESPLTSSNIKLKPGIFSVFFIMHKLAQGKTSTL